MKQVRDSRKVKEGSTYDILVRIHENLEPVLLALPEHAHSVVHKLIVILAATPQLVEAMVNRSVHSRALMLQRFPCHWKPEHIESPPPEPREMHVRRPIVEV